MCISLRTILWAVWIIFFTYWACYLIKTIYLTIVLTRFYGKQKK